MGEHQRTLYKIPEAAEYLAVSRSTIYNLIRKKKLRAVRIGRSVRIPAADLRAIWKQQ